MTTYTPADDETRDRIERLHAFALETEAAEAEAEQRELVPIG